MNADDAKDSKLTLSFDYLFAKASLKWVTIRSKHAIVISMMLQSVRFATLFIFLRSPSTAKLYVCVYCIVI